MTILQGLKKIKHLDRKIEKSRERISRWCSYLSDEEPMYNADGVRKLLQSTMDLITERNIIRHAIHKTNILVQADFQGKKVTVDELIIMTTLTIPAEIATLKLLRRKEKQYHHNKEAKVVLQYDPHERDKEIDKLEDTLDTLNVLLDNINITTELIK